MYLENAANHFDVGYTDPRKYPGIFLREDEVHFRTFIFDALPFLPPGATADQRERHEKKQKYLEAIQYQIELL